MKSRELNKPFRFQDLILPNSNLDTLFNVRNETKVTKYTHMSQNKAPTVLGLRLLASHPFRVAGSSWVPVPPLESSDSPHFTAELTAGLWGQSPRQSWARVQLLNQLRIKRPASNLCLLRSVLEVMVSDSFTASISQSVVLRSPRHPMFHVKRIP